MPVNLTNPRPYIIYLRRRLKRGESLPVTQNTTTAPRSGGITLGRSTTEAVTAEKVAGSVVPNAVGLSFLKEVNDAYRFNKRQSAIGSLVIENAMVAGWQLQDGTSGYLYNSGVDVTESPETKPIAFKGRPWIEFHKELLVFSLKNFKTLKRLIVVPKIGTTLQAETMGGTGVVMDHEPFTALYISVIGSVLEFRKEDFRDTITDTFNLHTVKPQIAHENPSLRTLFS
jgi:hypothetical protein